MTALAWKLNRVRCMSARGDRPSPGEDRSIHAERLGLARCEVPEADLAFVPQPGIHADAHVDAARYLEAADRSRQAPSTCSRSEGVRLGAPPNWNRDPRTGIEAPLTFGKLLDYRDRAPRGRLQVPVGAEQASALADPRAGLGAHARSALCRRR
jgi:hypothetical protein